MSVSGPEMVAMEVQRGVKDMHVMKWGLKMCVRVCAQGEVEWHGGSKTSAGTAKLFMTSFSYLTLVHCH